MAASSSIPLHPFATTRTCQSPRLPIRFWPPKPCRRERNFLLQRRQAKNRSRRPRASLETKTADNTGENPRRNGLLAVDDDFRGSVGLDGGRDRDRTCDPLDVNEVLSR
jgi:hypothetical protein